MLMQPPQLSSSRMLAEDMDLVWQWEDNNHWKEFEANSSKRISSSHDRYKSGRGSHLVTIQISTPDSPLSYHVFEFNFKEMTQTGLRSNRQRNIRLTKISSSLETNAAQSEGVCHGNQYQWEWQSGVRWNIYSVDNCDKLEQAFQSGHTTCDVRTDWGEYEIDFKKWKQQPKYCSFGKTRAVRRLHGTAFGNEVATGNSSEDAALSTSQQTNTQPLSIFPELAQGVADLCGTWQYYDARAVKREYIIYSVGGHLTFYQAGAGRAVLKNDSEWFNGELDAGYIRLKLSDYGHIVSNFKPSGFASWCSAIVSNRKAAGIGTNELCWGERTDSQVVRTLCRAILDASSQGQGCVQDLITRSLGVSASLEKLNAKLTDALLQDTSALAKSLLLWTPPANPIDQIDMIQPLPRDEQGSYDWIRQDNTFLSRSKRLNAAYATIVLGSIMGVSKEWLSQTCFVDCCDSVSTKRRNVEPELRRSSKEVFEEVLDPIHRGEQLALVNAASAYHVGGGFLTGGRHAFEESACMQSTLFFSLHKAKLDAKEWNLRGRPFHIPEDGIVFTPNVKIFRDGSAEGYSWRQEPITVKAILSVAMPNRNFAVHDTPYEYDVDDVYRLKLKKKWIAVLKGAAKAGADTLVVPDVGCGVFKNDPTIVGNALGQALQESTGQLKHIIICGSEEFFKAINSHPKSKQSSIEGPRQLDSTCQNQTEAAD